MGYGLGLSNISSEKDVNELELKIVEELKSRGFFKIEIPGSPAELDEGRHYFSMENSSKSGFVQVYQAKEGGDLCKICIFNEVEWVNTTVSFLGFGKDRKLVSEMEASLKKYNPITYPI